METFKGLKTSSGTRGWYTTVATDEVISFPAAVYAIKIFAKTDLTLVLNGDEANILYVDQGETEDITGLPVLTMKIVGASGQQIKYIAAVRS